MMSSKYQDWIEALGRLGNEATIVESWHRSADAGVSRTSPAFRRVSTTDLFDRQVRNGDMLAVAVPHLRWLSRWLNDRPHVVYVVDRDGIVLHSEGSAEAIEQFRLAPGFDWSEAQMGTNGAGTALACGVPSAIVGCDHWNESWLEATCLGAPITGPDGTIIGAIDISTDVRPGDADRLVIAAHAAYAITLGLRRRQVDQLSRVHRELYEEARAALASEQVALAEAQAAVARERQAQLIAIKADADMRESEARFRVMADTSPVMIWVTDAEGDVEFVNRAYIEFFGASDADLRRPRGWQPLVHPADAEHYVGGFLKALRDRTPFFGEARVRRADGAWRWVASYAAPRVSPDGRMLGMVGSSPDITEMKEAAESVKAAMKHKDDFLATVSHELRQPIHAAQAAVSLLNDPALSARAGDIIARQLAQMSRIVEDLLDASAIMRDDVHLRMTTVDIRELVQTTIDATMPQMNERGHVVEQALPATRVPLLADPDRLQQVVSNLLANAAKYTPNGGRIRVSLATEDGEVVLRVQDNGIGIPPEVLPRIFELFARAGATNQRGFGIGLAVVAKLVNAHGGRVEARSGGVDTGAEFIVRLPIANS